MGVNLRELIPTKEIEFENLAGKTIALDTFNIMFQFLSTVRDRFTGEPLRDSKGRVTSHLSGLFYRGNKMLEVGVTPVFVFDGKAPDFKASVQEERAKIRKEAEVKWRKAVEDGDLEKVRMYSQGSSKLTSSMIDEAKELLGLMGISWIQAPSEGEAQASYFAKQGKVWAAGSQDWDSLLFATPRLIRNLSISGRKKVPMKERYITVNPEIIDLEEVLSHLGITQDQLIILGMLVGTDYNPGGIKGVGPKGALKLVREEKTLENVLKKVKWEAESSPEKVFDFFKNPPVEDLEIKKEKYNYEALKEMLMDHDFSEERIENTLKKLDEKKKKGQSNLGKFFGT